MVVFAWILFIVAALVALGALYTWFSEGVGLFTLLSSAAAVVYLVKFLFFTPFGLIATWIYFVGACLLLLFALLMRNVFTFTWYGAFVVFFAIILF